VKSGERFDTFVTAHRRRITKGLILRQEIAKNDPGAGADTQIEVANRRTRR
jgi:hypothetical protein